MSTITFTQPYKHFWGQLTAPIIYGGRVSTQSVPQEPLQPQIQTEQEQSSQLLSVLHVPQMKSSSRMAPAENTFSSIGSNQLDGSLKSMLMKAGIKQKELNDPQYAPVIKAIIQESQRMQPQQSKYKSTMRVQNSITPKKSIFIQSSQLPSQMAPPPPPPPPIATLGAASQKKAEAFGGDLLDQLKHVQLKKFVPTQTLAETVKKENDLTNILAQAIEERRQQIRKNYVSSSSSSSGYSSDY